ncbi:hypothetical protein [Methylacidimicrobium sp. B4]|uniref:hypothetical protein n=1 Tax=Methylacidimicrobium sp. B4 TaxID=2796139 RepID=UPI001A907EDF|nr:hypothetical protein [Methylacidimicrobium sp. B4]QSR85002.1 hypothetical protein MacB4_01650 [Methylacidimicrobium sp. B4]
MASLSEVMILLALSLALAGRAGDLLFLLLYPAWCAFWESKIRSRPIHWLLRWRLEPFGRFTFVRSLARGLLRPLFPFLHLGWRRVTLFDFCTRCRWAVCAGCGQASPPVAAPNPAGHR